MASPSVGVKLVGFGWSFFIIENVILSHNRTLVINEIGDDKYHLLYNSLSLASCLSISIGLLKGTRSPSLFKKNLLLKTMAFGLRGTGFVLISQQIPALRMPSGKNMLLSTRAVIYLSSLDG